MVEEKRATTDLDTSRTSQRGSRVIRVSRILDLKEQTKLFFQRKLTFMQGLVFIFVQFYIVGLVQGYTVSIEYILQEKGASFADQTKFSLISYPYSYKFFVSPFMDRFFLRNFGRSRTYTVFAGIVISVVFCFLGGFVELFIEEKRINALVLMLACVSSVNILIQIASEAWILTLFSKENKSKASLMIGIGQTFGIMCGYNFFTPLNSVSWVNKHFFHSNPRSTPLVTHQMFLFFAVIVVATSVVCNVLFVAEEKINDDRTKSLCKILSILPRSFTHANMRNLIAYIFATRIFVNMCLESLQLKLIRNGYQNMLRTDLSSIDIFVYPITLAVSCFSIKFIKQGKIINVYHWMMLVVVLVGFFKYVSFRYLIATKDTQGTYYLLVITSIFNAFNLSTGFLIGYYNLIIDKSVANTSITCLIALMNQTGSLPKTLGLYLTDKVDFDHLVYFAFGTQILVLALYYPYSFVLDKRGKKE